MTHSHTWLQGLRDSRHTRRTQVLLHGVATMTRNGADEVSVLLFWQYLASVVTIPAVLAVQLTVIANMF